MPKDSNEDANIDELLAELKNETSEESTKSKKLKSHENTATHEYDDKEENDDNW